MVKPLVTHRDVWTILLFIFCLMTIFFALFFYFYHLSIAFVLGLWMLFITKRLLISYRFKEESQSRKIIRAFAIMLFWGIILYFLYHYAFHEIRSIASDFKNPQTHVAKNIRDSVLSFFYQKDGSNAEKNWFMYALVSADDIQKVIDDIYNIMVHAFLIIPLLFIYYFYKARHLKESFLHSVPLKYKNPIEKAFHTVSHILETDFMNKVRIANSIALFSAIGFYIIGLKGAFLLALLSGILHIIPHIGIWIATAVCVFIAGIQNPLHSGGDFLFNFPIDSVTRMVLVFSILIFVILLHKLYLKKFFSPSKISVDPLLNIVLILAAAKILGVMGMFFIIPIYSMYKVVIHEFYLELTKNSHS